MSTYNEAMAGELTEDEVPNIDGVVMPVEVFDTVYSIVGYAAYQQQQKWEQAGRPDDHVWHIYQRVCDWLDEQEVKPWLPAPDAAAGACVSQMPRQRAKEPNYNE
jgi:hypothetical protein